jgi:hypothetical protein
MFGVRYAVRTDLDAGILQPQSERPRIHGIPIDDEVPLAVQEPVPAIRETAGDLLHPGGGRVRHRARDVDTSGGEIDDEQGEVADQSA